ncbi:MAG: sugar ABC transporter permease [Anaerolineae bacterium]|nr:sugar ABC transporter permease [Anaerolineae bacterium]
MASSATAIQRIPATSVEAAAGPFGIWFRRLMFIPTLIYLVIMTIFPLIYSLGISFFDYTMGGQARFVGLRNYIELLSDPQVWQALGVTLQLTVSAVIIELVLGAILGFVFYQGLPLFSFLRLLVFMPMMLAPLVVGLFWRFLLDQTFGLVNFILTTLGLPPVPWLIHPRFALLSVLIVDVWQWTPFVTLLVIAGLGTVPQELKEAAALDRASGWMRFRHIYWPYLRFPILLALLFRSIDVMKMFDVPYILTGGGPGNFTTTLSLLAYRYHFQFFQISKAAAVAWLIVILINIVANLAIRWLMPKPSQERVDTGL